MKPNISEKLLDCFGKMQTDIALIKQQNGRVGKLEMWQNYVVGIGTTVAGVFTYLFSRK